MDGLTTYFFVTSLHFVDSSNESLRKPLARRRFSFIFLSRSKKRSPHRLSFVSSLWQWWITIDYHYDHATVIMISNFYMPWTRRPLCHGWKRDASCCRRLPRYDFFFSPPEVRKAPSHPFLSPSHFNKFTKRPRFGDKPVVCKGWTDKFSSPAISAALLSHKLTILRDSNLARTYTQKSYSLSHS